MALLSIRKSLATVFTATTKNNFFKGSQGKTGIILSPVFFIWWIEKIVLYLS